MTEEELMVYIAKCRDKRMEQAREIRELKKAVAFAQIAYLHTNDNYYWTPHANEKYIRMEAALNKIGIMAMGAMAYTSKFTTETQSIVREALGLKEKW